MAAPPLRWGVMGSGWIAGRFIGSLRRHTRQQVVAIARSARFDVPRAHGSYEALVADDDVDVVYVATPHPLHLACARLALEAGKPVLVEKPLGLSADEAAELAALAAARGLFCMEALWTLFLPRFDVVRQVLESGALGEVRTVLADNGESFAPDHRILRADLAGGPLLDLGTYPLALATWVLGAPERITAAAQPHPAGVHGQLGAILSDAGGNQAVVHTTVFSDTPTSATIAGTEATLMLPGPFYMPGDVIVGEHRYEEPAVAHDALHFEAAEVARCVAEGRLESPLRPLADSITTLRAMDEVRRQCGIEWASTSTR
jgi:predicted dehydrogenase